MKKTITILASLISLLGFSQTSGTLTFSYTPTSHSGYDGQKNVLAIWIQKGNGDFVKTRVRYVGLQTSDHLDTWMTNSGGSFSALSPSCNVVDATTGATLTSFGTQTITWDGTDVNGNIVADGTYKVTVESTWDHGNNGGEVRSFTFTKGVNDDVQTPSDDANFTNINLEWVASLSNSIEELSKPSLVVYPNPTAGLLNVNYTNASSIKVVSILGEIVESRILTNVAVGVSRFDLSNYTNGIYTIVVSEGDKTTSKMIVLNK